MTTELRPLGVTCNLACRYCYQNPERDAGNEGRGYDLEKMKAAALAQGGPFTLFGGEPLMMRFADLEDLFTWGLATFGGSSIQTNGVLIEDRHIELFRRCKVSVGISIDGPGALNDARWHRGLDRTRRSTARVQAAIARLCAEYEPPGLIVTLHQGNAAADRLPLLLDWFRELDALGMRSVRLHLLEVDDATVRDRLALSPGENIAALLACAELEDTLSGLRFDIFKEMEQLLAGDDSHAGCTWRACDPYTTLAVQGIEGNGQTSNCGRTNKDGIGFIKSDTRGYERYLALFATPQSENGCAGCRFFLMCKGQCPGTAIDGDWRNRTEHCEVWMQLFAFLERRIIARGKTPLTLQPIRALMEQRYLRHWSRGENPPMGWIASALSQGSDVGDPATPSPRISWVGEGARDLWRPRFERIRFMLEDMTVHVARPDSLRCTARVVSRSASTRLRRLAAGRGVSLAVLPRDALSDGVHMLTDAEDPVLVVAGSPDAVRRCEDAARANRRSAVYHSLDVPACCRAHAALRRAGAGVVETVWDAVPDGEDRVELEESVLTHSLLAPLGLHVLPLPPCSLDCPAAGAAYASWFELATRLGYGTEVGWLRACLGWAITWSAVHGVTEVKTPVLKLAVRTERCGRRREILRRGQTDVQGAVAGLRFPFPPPVRPGRDALRA